MNLNHSSGTKKLHIILLCVSLCAVLFTGYVSAASNVNQPIKGDFYIVYDNSSSADKYDFDEYFVYILERLSVMVDFESGSELIIYPILPVTISGVRSQASTEPIVLNSYSDIVFLRNMYTEESNFTPFDSVVEAYKDLNSDLDADIKHLFIISDCDFNDPISIYDVYEKIDEMLEHAAKDPSFSIHCIINELTMVENGTSSRFLKEDGRGCSVVRYIDWREAADYCIDVGLKLFNQNKFTSSEGETVSFVLSGDINTVKVIAEGDKSSVVSLNSPDGSIVTPSLFSAFGDMHSPSVNELSVPFCFAIYENLMAGTYTLTVLNTDDCTVVIQNPGDPGTEPIFQIVGSSDQPQNTDKNDLDSQFSGSHTVTEKSHDEFDNGGGLILFTVTGIASLTICIWLVIKRKRKPMSIFISYRRRENTKQLAGRIYDRLSLLGYDVFRDRDSLTIGDYKEQLKKGIDKSDFVMVILSPESFVRSLDEDIYYWEIAYALHEKKIMIPVTLEGLRIPDQLDEIIKELMNFQIIEMSDGYYDSFINKIVEHTKCKRNH